MAIRPFTFDDDILGMKVRSKRRKLESIIYTKTADEVLCGGSWTTYGVLLVENEQLDGTPCGVEVLDSEPELPDSMIDGQWAAKDADGTSYIFEIQPEVLSCVWKPKPGSDCIEANIPSFDDIPWERCCFQKRSNKETR